MLHRLIAFAAFISVAPVLCAELGAAEKVDAEAARFFETKVRPLLVERCYQCHDANKKKGELRLDARSLAMKGGESGVVIVPGKPGDSLLIKAIGHGDKELQMPPKTKLSDAEIETLTHWVKIGAPWPGDDPATLGANSAGPKVRPKSAKITDEDRRFWFFQPLMKSAVPEVKDKSRVVNAIDAFILAKLEASNRTIAPSADKLTLIRRATFDLHGLPPTPQEIDTFIADTSGGAYEKLLDRLLASPRYGERQARLWLDLVRYADSDGFKSDDYRPHIWRYRDWVIDAFNEDLPYDKFITAQLAGDELDESAFPAKPTHSRAWAPEATRIATGYLRLWPYEYNQRDVHKQWNEILDDITGNVGEVFLGLSMHCARCHNHKFDPILQEDYFKLRAYFAAVLPDDSLTAERAQGRADYDEKLAAWSEQTKDLRAKIEAIEGPARNSAERGSLIKFTDELQKILTTPVDQLSPFDQQIRDLAYRQLIFEHKGIPGKIKPDKKAELDKLYADLRKFDATKPPPLTEITAVRDVGNVAPPTIIPGDKANREIRPGLLTVLGVTDAKAGDANRRLTFAQWLTRPDNALTTRVIVNRLWQQHFSTGLVATANDFGHQGELPTHPELLDWLAQDFVAHGWSIKRAHKTMMLSSAYQQQSAANPQSEIQNPKSSPPLRRLDAESLRDAMLRASRELNESQMYGPGVSETVARRSIYLKFMRNNRPELIETFDGPDGFNSTSKRNTTTIAPQALMLINGDWSLARARKLAESARSDAAGSQAKMIAEAYRRTLGRAPTDEESKDAAEFIEEQAKQVAPPKLVDANRKPEEKPAPSHVQAAGITIEANKNQHMRMADNAALRFEEFTLETVFTLRSIAPDANVRVIASQWDGNPDHAGWSIGVTGQKSKFQPQTIILQLVGKNEDGQTAYDVVVSGLKPQVNKPYHLVVSVKLSEVDSTGVAFHLRPINADGSLGTPGNAELAEVGHTVIKGIDNDVAFVIGGRDKQQGNSYDGLIAEVRLYNEGLSPQQLVGGRNPKKDALVGDWRFAEGRLAKDSSGRKHDLTAVGIESSAASTAPAPKESKPQNIDAKFEAFVDFCHVLLNSNEFLYVD